MKIRQITNDERPLLSMPIQAYAFQASPVDEDTRRRLDAAQQYHADQVTLVAEEDGVAVADASALPMHQNVRGAVYKMAGIAGVATLPHARRRGYGRALVSGLLGMMRDSGHVVSALYPFRASFYERSGFVGLPQVPSATFSPSGLAWLLRTDLPGSVHWGPVAEHYDDHLALARRLLDERHGFSTLPGSRLAQYREDESRWLAVAQVDGTVAATVSYRITGYAGELVADDMLCSSALGRALLLRFFATHIDQVTRIKLRIPPGETPELWATDLELVTETRVSSPGSPAPMARVLSLEGLTGMPVGNARVTVEVTDDSLIGGGYTLDGTTGTLAVRPDPAGDAAATLTAAGLSGLVYGVLDPDDVVVRGYGQLGPEAAALLRTLFPRCVPYVSARF
ncbi:MAG TPA: GNAT family N-acetyltransferase [Streptosporangiaceae bacterium]|nr:GNAT family N-acetyltransferase [Streptosporangiaceae bacterium]